MQTIKVVTAVLAVRLLLKFNTESFVYQ